MAKKEDKKEYYRVTADFSPQAYATLKEISEKLGSNKADTIRRSLGLILYVLNQKAKGRRLVVENEDGKDRTEIVTI
jgi:hypothetical protein